MTAFRVGMKVVFLGHPNVGMYAGCIYPKAGHVYTIRAINPNKPILLLDEIRNALTYDGIEPGFCSSAFRPAVSRPTSIAVFQAMLTGKKARVEA